MQVCEFYFDFCRDLHRRCDEQDEILCVSSIGQSGLSHEHTAYSLQDQLRHKTVLVAALLGRADVDECAWMTDIGMYSRANTIVPLTIMGHSIGAWICLKIASELDDSVDTTQLRSVVSLFPTIRSLSVGLHPVVRIATYPIVRHVAAAVLHIAPTWLARFLLHATNDMTDESKYATAGNMNEMIVPFY